MAKQNANADGFGKFKFELTGVGSRVVVIPERPCGSGKKYKECYGRGK